MATWATAGGEGLRTPDSGPNPPGISTATDHGTSGTGSFGFFSWWKTDGLQLLAACTDCKLCNTEAEVMNISHDERVNYYPAEIGGFPQERVPRRKRTGDYSLPVTHIAGASLHQQREVTHAASSTSCNQPSLFSEASTQFVSGTLSPGSAYTATQREQPAATPREQPAELSGTSTCGADECEVVEPEEEEQTASNDGKLPTVDPQAQFDVQRPAGFQGLLVSEKMESIRPGEALVTAEFAEESLLREQSSCLDCPNNLAPDATPECVDSTRNQPADGIGNAKSRSRSLDVCRGMRSRTQGSKIRSKSIATDSCGTASCFAVASASSSGIRSRSITTTDQATSGDVLSQLCEALPPKPETASGTPDESGHQLSANVPVQSPELTAAAETAAAAQAELEAALAASAVHHTQAAAQATGGQELAAAAAAAASAPAPGIESTLASTPTNAAFVVVDALPNLAEKAELDATLAAPATHDVQAATQSAGIQELAAAAAEAAPAPDIELTLASTPTVADVLPDLAEKAELEAALAVSATDAAQPTGTQELPAAATAGAEAAAPVPDIEATFASTPTHAAFAAEADVPTNFAEKDGERANLTEALPPVLIESVDAEFTQDSCAKAEASRATSSTADSPLSLLSEQHELGDSGKPVAEHEVTEEILSPPTTTFDNQLPAQTMLDPDPEPSKPSLVLRRGASISARAQAYAAACQSTSAGQSTPEKCTPKRRLVRKKTGSFDMPLDKPERPFRTLSKVTEQRVLKAGLVCLGDQMLVGHDVGHMELPRTSAGIPKVMQGAAFLRRLLKQEVELKGCMEGDVAAAQADVKHLRAEQLLSIRLPTLDFATESQSHNARNGFLDTTDKYLFYKLAQRCLTECSQVPTKFEAVHRLGIRISVTLGVLDHLSKGWGTQTANAEDLLPIPPFWVIKLDREDWPQQCRAAIFHSGELWVRSLPGEAPDFAAATTNSHLAIVRDRTTGVGKDRMLHWEIVVMESCSTEDILYEMDRDPAGNKKSSLTAELSATILQRARGSV